MTYDADGDPPNVGDVLVSTGGSGYLILEARQVRSTYYPDRWRYLCLRVDPAGDANTPAGARRHPLFWYSRKAKR